MRLRSSHKWRISPTNSSPATSFGRGGLPCQANSSERRWQVARGPYRISGTPEMGRIAWLDAVSDDNVSDWLARLEAGSHSTATEKDTWDYCAMLSVYCLLDFLRRQPRGGTQRAILTLSDNAVGASGRANTADLTRDHEKTRFK